VARLARLSQQVAGLSKRPAAMRHTAGAVYRSELQRTGGPMRKLVVTENITLDGVIDMAGGMV